MQYKYAFKLSLPKLHISFLEVGRKRRQKLKMPWWGNKHFEGFENTIWGMHVNYVLFQKNLSKLLRWENGMRWLCSRAVPFLNRSRRYVSHSTYPASIRYVLGLDLWQFHILNCYVYVYFIFKLYSRTSKGLSVGVLLTVLKCHFRPSTLPAFYQK